MPENLTEILTNFWPLLVLQIVVQIIALISLSRRTKVRFNNKWIWVLIIIFLNIIGPIVYFAFRGDEDEDSSED
jgi:glucan phosphoethanolaminetransferase (alkaline phosphatase superfamily)